MKNEKITIVIIIVAILGAGAALLLQSFPGLKGSFYVNGIQKDATAVVQDIPQTKATQVAVPEKKLLVGGINDKKTDFNPPEQIKFVEPKSNQNLFLPKVKTYGIPFSITDGNKLSHLKDDYGNYYLNYKWKLSKENTLIWASEWTSSFPQPYYGAEKCITKVNTLDEKKNNIWTCTSGRVPASALKNITAGTYTLEAEVGDGASSPGPTSVTFSINGGENTTTTIDTTQNTPSKSTSHQIIVDTFKTGLVWEPVKWEDTEWSRQLECPYKEICGLLKQFDYRENKGDYSYVYKIHLTEEAKKTLAYANDDKFFFKYVYKPYWGEKAGKLIESDIVNFKILPGAKLIVINNGDGGPESKNIIYDGTDIYIKVDVPWPGLAIASDNVEQWGMTDVDIYFYDSSETTSAPKQISVGTKYRTEKLDRPNLYVQATSSGCVGFGDFDFQIVNSGGPMPHSAWGRLLLYASGDGYGPAKLYDAFGDATPIMDGYGGRSDWECHDAGNGNLWLVRDTIMGDTTIWHEKVETGY